MNAWNCLLAETFYEHIGIFFRGTFVWVFFGSLFIAAIVVLVLAKKARQKQ
ncbi:MAG: hypothetical protein AB7G28_20305 [Pirellulales bacterium]